MLTLMYYCIPRAAPNLAGLNGPRFPPRPELPGPAAARRRLFMQRKVWRLVVWRVPPELAGLMARLKLQPTRTSPASFWRNYPAAQKKSMLAAVDLLRRSGLHGVARLVDAPMKPLPRYRQRPQLVSREGFGGPLNATPIKGIWRRKTRH